MARVPFLLLIEDDDAVRTALEMGLTRQGHRVVTAASKLAMPEISIGLYPDVGGSWFLRRMPGKVGLFLALTGAPLNAADALRATAKAMCLISVLAYNGEIVRLKREP